MAPRVTKQQVEKIFEWRAKGKSNQLIADLVGVSRNTVERYLKKGCTCLGVHDMHTTKCPQWKATQ